MSRSAGAWNGSFDRGRSFINAETARYRAGSATLTRSAFLKEWGRVNEIGLVVLWLLLDAAALQ